MIMKEIVFISGKGGTGKTSFTASFAYLGGNKVVIADADVEAPDMHILLQPVHESSQVYYSGAIALINKDICISCGKCRDVCSFNAIDSDYIISSLNCEGCGYCKYICSEKAIDLNEQHVGDLYISSTKVGSKMVHANLKIGADNSGKLVSKVKSEARNVANSIEKEILIVDGAPGIGCPVISSLSGASSVVLITEPSLSGFHDLKRVYELVKRFDLKVGCIINKYDLNLEITTEIEKFLIKEHIEHIANFQYDKSFYEAMTQGKTVMEYDNIDLKKLMEQSWNKILNLL